MKVAKQFLSLLLTLGMLLSLFPSVVVAANSSGVPFTDVNETDWFYEAVEYVYQNGMMDGTGNDRFSPKANATRGMVVTVLYRMEGSPSASGTSFDDVDPEAYYADGTSWAAENGIVLGFGNDRFGPHKKITREQMATILYRYAQYKEYEVVASGDVTSFTDGNLVSPYAVKAMNWAVGVGLLFGVGGNTLRPAGNATRGQIATILMRFCKKYEVSFAERHVVTFDYNYEDRGTYEAVAVNDGETVDRPLKPSRNGHYFGGWYTEATGGEMFHFDTPIVEDITLYAKWNVNDPMRNPDESHTGSYSRQEWIKLLVGNTGLESSSSEVDSSFDDVVNDKYIAAVETALQNGVIFKTDDNLFYPEESATETFAVVTAVRALGYTYEDIESCCQIAKDIGLIKEDVSNTNNLTLRQASDILKGIKRILDSTEIDPNAEPMIDITANTVVLNDTDLEYTYSPAAGPLSATSRGAFAQIVVQATEDELGVEAGNCVLMPETEAFPGGLAQKVVGVEAGENGTTVLHTVTPTLEEFMGEEGRLTTEGIASTNASDFVMSDEFTKISPTTYCASTTANTNRGAVPVTIKVTCTEESVDVALTYDKKDSFFKNTEATIKVFYPTVEYNVDLEKKLGVPVGVNDLYLAFNEKVEVAGSLGKSAAFLKELGRIPIPLGAGFSVDIVFWLHITASGELSLSYTVESTNGIQYTNGRLRKISQSQNNLEFKPLECEVKAGPEISAMLTLGGVFDLADITVGAGLAVDGSLTTQGLDAFCVDGNCYTYLNISALNDDRCLLGELLKIGGDWTIADEENSTFKRNLHYEAKGTTFEKVPVCNYGDGDFEGTVRDSKTSDLITNFEMFITREEDHAAVDFVKNIVDGKLLVKDLPAGTYLITIVADGYHPLQKQVTILANRTVNVGTLRLISTSIEQGSGSGTVTDAITGNPVEGALVELYQGGSTYGEPVSTTTTNASGEFTLEGIAGNYSIVVSKSGYTESTDDFILTSPETANQNIALIPLGVDDTPEGTISEIGDLRIVLTWGKNPHDLDSHLCGPTASGMDRFHIYYSQKTYLENSIVHSFLDLDDISSYGPETTTVYNIKDNGKYSFYVHDFSNSRLTSSTALANSGATVKVYVKEAIEGEFSDNGEQLYRAKMIAALYVPNSEGTLWHVFDYNAATGELIRRDTMAYLTSPPAVGTAIQQTTEETSGDIEMIRASITEKE